MNTRCPQEKQVNKSRVGKRLSSHLIQIELADKLSNRSSCVCVSVHVSKTPSSHSVSLNMCIQTETETSNLYLETYFKVKGNIMYFFYLVFTIICHRIYLRYSAFSTCRLQDQRFTSFALKTFNSFKVNSLYGAFCLFGIKLTLCECIFTNILPKAYGLYIFNIFPPRNIRPIF